MDQTEPNQTNLPPLTAREIAVHSFVWSAIVAAAFLNIGRSLRADDVWSLTAVAQPLNEMLAAIKADVHPPLYFVLLQSWVRLFGPNELAARTLSILFHLAASAVVFLTGRWLAGRGVGLLCAAVYGLAPLAVLSAELVRMYSLTGFLSAAALYLWFVWSKGEAGRIHGVGLFAGVVLGSFTHTWFLCLVFGLGVAAIVHLRRQAVPILAVLAIALLPFTFVWLPALVTQVGKSGDSTAWLKPPSVQMLGELLFVHAGASCLFLLFYLSPKFRRRGPECRTPLSTLTIAAATLLPPLLISIWHPFFSPRFTIVALPAVAVALGGLLSRIKPAHAAASIAVAALVFHIGAWKSAPACDGLCAAELLARSVQNGDVVVYSSLSRPAVSYYLKRLAPGRSWREQSFPAIIDTHPGYEGSHLRASDLSALSSEASATAAQFRLSGARRVYFLSGYRPRIEDPMIRALSAAYDPKPSLIRCGGGDYYTEIRVFDLRPNRQ